MVLGKVLKSGVKYNGLGEPHEHPQDLSVKMQTTYYLDVNCEIYRKMIVSGV